MQGLLKGSAQPHGLLGLGTPIKVYFKTHTQGTQHQNKPKRWVECLSNDTVAVLGRKIYENMNPLSAAPQEGAQHAQTTKVVTVVDVDEGGEAEEFVSTLPPPKARGRGQKRSIEQIAEPSR